MLRVVAVGACLLVVLAGCSSGPASDGGEAPATASSSSRSVLTFAPPPPTTDTMYLLAAPHMSAMPPVAGEESRTPIPSGLEAEDTVLWTMPRQGLGIILANATLWVDVKGTHLHPGSANGGCFWTFLIRAGTNDQSTWIARGSECPAAEESVVQPGIRRLDVVFGELDAVDVQGDTISLWLSAGVDAESPGSTVEVLSGPEYPSSLTVKGLALPLDTRTLLV